MFDRLKTRLKTGARERYDAASSKVTAQLQSFLGNKPNSDQLPALSPLGWQLLLMGFTTAPTRTRNTRITEEVIDTMHIDTAGEKFIHCLKLLGLFYFSICVVNIPTTLAVVGDGLTGNQGSVELAVKTATAPVDAFMSQGEQDNATLCLYYGAVVFVFIRLKRRSLRGIITYPQKRLTECQIEDFFIHHAAEMEALDITQEAMNDAIDAALKVVNNDLTFRQNLWLLFQFGGNNKIMGFVIKALLEQIDEKHHTPLLLYFFKVSPDTFKTISGLMQQQKGSPALVVCSSNGDDNTTYEGEIEE